MKNRRGDLIVRVLTTLENGIVAYAHNPGRSSASFYRMLREFDALQKASDIQLRNAAKYALHKKYVTQKVQNGKVLFTISAAGAKLTRRYIQQRLPPISSVKWDRTWRLVMFDIPNYRRKQRNAFAVSLRRMGFKSLQKSVFIYPHACKKELEEVMDLYEVRDYVEIIEAERISSGDLYVRIFGLEK